MSQPNNYGLNITHQLICSYKGIEIYYVPECNHYEFTPKNSLCVKSSLERCKVTIDSLK